MPINTTPRGALTNSQMLNPINTGGSEFVRQGAVDQSGWYAGMARVANEANKQLDYKIGQSAVQAFGQGASIIGEGLVLNDVQSQTQSLVDEYVNNINAMNHGVDATAYSNMSDSLWKNLSSKNSAQTIADINVVDQKHSDTLNKLSRAYKEGAITSLNDLEARVLAVTRSAVNRTPGMAQQIMNQTAQVLHLSGVRNMKNPFEDMARQQAKQEDATMKMLTKYHIDNKIPFDPLSPDYYQMARTMQDDLVAQQKMRQMKQMVDAGEQFEKGQIKTFLRQDFPQMLTGGYNNIRSYAAQVFAPGSDYSTAKFQFRDFANKQKEELTQMLQHSGAISTSEGQRFYQSMEKAIDNIIEPIESFQNGADALKYIQNTVDNTASVQKQRAMEYFNLPMVQAMGNLSGFVKDYVIKQNADRISEVMKGALETALTGNHWESSSLKDGVSDVTMATKGLVAPGLTSSLAKSFDAVADSINTMADPATRVKNLTSHFKELGDTELQGKIKINDPSVEAPFFRGAEHYLTLVSDMFNKSEADAGKIVGFDKNYSLGVGIESVDKALGVSQTQYPKAKFSVGEGGMLSVSVSNDKGDRFRRMWQSDVADRFNDVIRTYSNVTGLSYKEASKHVLSRFGSMLNMSEEDLKPLSMGSRGQNVNNPGNIKVPGENRFQDFGSIDNGIKAVKDQLMKYFDGSSSHVKELSGGRAITPEQMLNIYHNPSEKGSVSQQQYLSNIAKHSGLTMQDLQNPIDPNDSSTWQDLIYGILKAESKNNITMRDVRRALGG